MLYYLFDYLDTHYDLIGTGLFQYISFRSGAAAILSLTITIVFGKRFIAFLKNKQAREGVRDLGLTGQLEKEGTPTMGGLIIIGAILVPTLCFAKIDNIYVILLIVTTVWLGVIGLLDDYIKVYKKNKKGLLGWFKVFGQMGLGLIVGLTLYFHPDVKIRHHTVDTVATVQSSDDSKKDQIVYADMRSTKTTVPFFKDNEWDYSTLLPPSYKNYTWVVYTLIVILIITAVSNGANITDGIDGLATGTSAIIGLIIAIFAYLSGRVDFSSYLNIMHIPNLSELVIFCSAFVGACLGFLWYNAFPAQVFMGDTGSLALGGVIAVLALAIRKELMIPLFCGVFLVENLSVILQVYYFKYTRIRYGHGKRIFLMAPLHHHYQKAGVHESKIVTRFLIAGILLAILSLATLKLR